jgi:hypothetical protein
MTLRPPVGLALAARRIPVRSRLLDRGVKSQPGVDPE